MGRIKNLNQTKEKMNKIIALAALAFIGAQAADDTIAQKLNGNEREDDGGRRLAVDGDIDVQVTRGFRMDKEKVANVIENIEYDIDNYQLTAKEILRDLNDHPDVSCVGHSGSQFIFMPSPDDSAVQL